MKQNVFKSDVVKKKSSIIQAYNKKPSVAINKSVYSNMDKIGEKSLYDRDKDLKQQSREISRHVSKDKQKSKQKQHVSKNQIRTSKGSINKFGSKSIVYDNFFKQSSSEKLTDLVRLTISKNTFIYHYIIGKGGFGKVWKVEHKKNRSHYALKEMLKSLVMTKKSIQSVMNQRILLSDIKHPFIVNMHYAFQDRQTLYLVMDLMPGGDLRYHIGNRKRFSEIQAKFFIACIVIGLQYLHENKIIHRDIKPENLVLDEKGYIRITDLGIARIYRASNSNDTSGTPGYMSPEVICRQNHEYVSDYFALGVIAYELMFGKRPYTGKSRKEIRDQILAKQIQIKRNEVPDHWNFEAADFVNKLIQRKPEMRLGYGGISEIKQHPWLKQLSWKKIINKEIESPFIPIMKKDNFDQDEQITIDDEQQAELIEKNSLLLRKSEFQDLFKGYYFDGVKEKSTEATEKHYEHLISEESLIKIEDITRKSQEKNRHIYSNSGSGSTSKELASSKTQQQKANPTTVKISNMLNAYNNLYKQRNIKK